MKAELELKGAIFDMDGVLLNNVEYHLEAFRLFGQEQGRELTRAEVFQVFGRTNQDMLQVLLERSLSDEEVAYFGGRKEQIYRDLIEPRLEQAIVPGLLQFLEDLSREPIPAAIATSGPLDNVKFVEDRLEIRGFFEGFVTGEQVRQGKPHPEAFLKAAHLLGVSCDDCIVFEDSFSGIEAARRAGAKCVALCTTHTEQELRTVHQGLITPDFQELTWGFLCTAVSADSSS